MLNKLLVALVIKRNRIGWKHLSKFGKAAKESLGYDVQILDSIPFQNQKNASEDSDQTVTIHTTKPEVESHP